MVSVITPIGPDAERLFATLRERMERLESAIAGLPPMQAADLVIRMTSDIAEAANDDSLRRGAASARAYFDGCMPGRELMAAVGAKKWQQKSLDGSFVEIVGTLLPTLKYALGMIDGETAASTIESAMSRPEYITVLSGGIS